MIIEAIGEVLGNAVGVAISPLPVIALILMLLSRRAAANGVAFAVGWVVSLSAVATLVILAGFSGSDGDPSTASGVVKLVIGALFLLLAVRQWRSRPRDGEQPHLPAWMGAIDGFSPVRALGMAMLLGGLNPKNLGLTVAATTTIAHRDLTAGGQVVVVAVFVLLASLSVIVPIAYYLLAGERAEAVLTSTRSWLTANNNTVMTVLFLVLGAKTLGEGLAVLG